MAVCYKLGFSWKEWSRENLHPFGDVPQSRCDRVMVFSLNVVDEPRTSVSATHSKILQGRGLYAFDGGSHSLPVPQNLRPSNIAIASVAVTISTNANLWKIQNRASRRLGGGESRFVRGNIRAAGVPIWRGPPS